MKKGKGRVVGWTIELEWSNDVVEKYSDVDDTCASEVDTYLTEVLEPERNGFRRKRIRYEHSSFRPFEDE